MINCQCSCQALLWGESGLVLCLDRIVHRDAHAGFNCRHHCHDCWVFHPFSFQQCSCVSFIHQVNKICLCFYLSFAANPSFCTLSLPLERRSVTPPIVLSSTCALSVMRPATFGITHRTVSLLRCRYSLTMEGLCSLQRSWLSGVSWHWTSVCFCIVCGGEEGMVMQG